MRAGMLSSKWRRNDRVLGCVAHDIVAHVCGKIQETIQTVLGKLNASPVYTSTILQDRTIKPKPLGSVACEGSCAHLEQQWFAGHLSGSLRDGERYRCGTRQADDRDYAACRYGACSSLIPS